jgi:adenylate cyclase
MGSISITTTIYGMTKMVVNPYITLSQVDSIIYGRALKDLTHVRRSGSKVRVTAQLIEAETEALVWAQQFDGEVGDLLALEDDITRRITIALGIELVGREAGRPIRYPDAFDYILRGTAVMNAPKTRRTYAQAISLFDRALALDPRAAEAPSFLAIHLAGRVTGDVTDTAAADMARAEALAGQAVAASPRSALAHMAKRWCCAHRTDLTKPFGHTTRC